jgi:hypothetical protein
MCHNMTNAMRLRYVTTAATNITGQWWCYLCEIGGQSLTAVRVEVSDGGGEGGARYARRDAQRHNAAPRALSAVQLCSEVWVHQQIGEVAIALEGGLDAVQEARANDAPSLPDACTLAQLHAPAILSHDICRQRQV